MVFNAIEYVGWLDGIVCQSFADLPVSARFFAHVIIIFGRELLLSYYNL